ncbi:MAG TPA: CehA/McbA family metallohydrolase [Firmicutes bacterium]|nr:CehA/McbA family metallohydrolase [Bacillota bacterium]
MRLRRYSRSGKRYPRIRRHAVYGSYGGRRRPPGLLVAFYVLAAIIIIAAVASYTRTGHFAFWEPGALSGVVSDPAREDAWVPEALGKDFRILDPYDVPGEYYKAQLHAHTTRSDGKMGVADVIRVYEDRGFRFLALTDHDKVFDPAAPDVSDVTGLNGANAKILIIPGEEHTIPYILWPLGHHMLRLFVTSGTRERTAQAIVDSTQKDGGLAIPCHPSWTGNLGTGEWTGEELASLSGYRLMEIYNFHSNTGENIQRWHAVLRSRGPGSPVWGIAVDDSHEEGHIGIGWVMIKAKAFSLSAAKEALQGGHFYATTGPTVEFGVERRRIFAQAADGKVDIRFIDFENKPVAVFRSVREASYEPVGTEGFVRVEVTDTHGRTAWSQPFWLLRGDSSPLEGDGR